MVYAALCRKTPNEAVPLDHLKKLGVLYWKLKGEEDPKLKAIREARGYSYKVLTNFNPAGSSPLHA